MPDKTKLGAIDAGSNALRVVIAELGPLDIVRVSAERVPVRLGHGAFTHGALDAPTIDQAVAAFVRFREQFDANGVTLYRAVATSAVRNASNRDVLLHRIYHEAGIELDVIEGEEEARLVRKAVITAFGRANAPSSADTVAGVPRAILDLGGGSLEVNLRSGSAWRGYSLPVGTVRLLETFGLDGAIGDAEAGMVRRYAATLMQMIPRAADAYGKLAAATGGNAEALAKILAPSAGAAAGEMPGFDLAALEQELPNIVGASVDQRMERYGIKRDRAEVLGIAALVFATVSRQLGISRLVAPGVGVREGVLIELAETAREERALAEGAHDKALLTAARSFANRVDHDTTHGEHVRHLARTLFLQLRDVHGLPEQLGVVLEVAALLHDIGVVVNKAGHHKHSEYMIRHGRIPGLDDASRELIATMARAHRKDAARARELIAAAPLSKEQRGHARKLCAILRLADALDTDHRSRVEQIVCNRMGNAVVLDLIVRDGPSREDGQLNRKSDLFAQELGVEVKITVARPVAAPTAAAELVGTAAAAAAGGAVVPLHANAKS